MFAFSELIQDQRQMVSEPISHMTRTVGFIQGQVPDSTLLSICTGVAIGPHHVLTAAHCLYDYRGRPLQNIFFHPGTRGPEDLPYGRFPILEYAHPLEFDPVAPATIHTVGFDIAIASVGTSFKNGMELEELVGSYGLWGSDQVERNEMTTLGYPFDKPPRSLYRSEGCAVVEVTSLLLRSDCFLVSGQSGSPVLFQMIDSEDHAVAGVISATNRTDSYITRISLERYQILSALREGTYLESQGEFQEIWQVFMAN